MATLAELEQGVNQASQNLQNWQSSRKNPVDLLNEATAALGIPEVRTRVSNLRKSLLDTENLLSGVEGSVKGRTQGSLVTEAQRQRLTALEREPIAGQLSKTQGSYGMETANLNDLMGEASQQVSYGLEGQKMQGEKYQTALESSKSAYDRALELEKLKKQAEEAARERELRIKLQRESDKNANYRAGLNGSKEPTEADVMASMKKASATKGWGQLAADMEAGGYNISGGSTYDVYLKYLYGMKETGGKDPYKFMNAQDKKTLKTMKF